MTPNRFIAMHYAARRLPDPEERSRFVRKVQDGEPVEAFSDWPDFQELARETPTWER